MPEICSEYSKKVYGTNIFRTDKSPSRLPHKKVDKSVFSLNIYHMKLQINVENLPKRGEWIEFVFNKDDVNVDELKGEVKASMRIDKNGNIYNVKGSLYYTLELECSRCLENFEFHRESKFEYEFKKIQSYLPGYQQRLSY